MLGYYDTEWTRGHRRGPGVRSTGHGARRPKPRAFHPARRLSRQRHLCRAEYREGSLSIFCALMSWGFGTAWGWTHLCEKLFGVSDMYPVVRPGDIDRQTVGVRAMTQQGGTAKNQIKAVIEAWADAVRRHDL